MAKKTYKEISKIPYTQKVEGEVTYEEIKLGCMQRIADAAEAMAANFVRMQNDNDYLTRRNKELRLEVEKANRSASSYKVKYNHLKNKNNGI